MTQVLQHLNFEPLNFSLVVLIFHDTLARHVETKVWSKIVMVGIVRQLIRQTLVLTNQDRSLQSPAFGNALLCVPSA